MSYACKSENCSESYTTERGLNGHIARCAHYKVHEAKVAATRAQLRKEIQRKRAAVEANTIKTRIELPNPLQVSYYLHLPYTTAANDSDYDCLGRGSI